MRVKICGITNPDDARAAAEAGADAIGLNFVGGPRRIDLDTAASILDELPSGVTPVALVSLQSLGGSETIALVDSLGVTHLQVYGSFDPAILSTLEPKLSLMPVVAVRDEEFDRALTSVWATWKTAPTAVVLDTWDASRAGGTGCSFEWAWVAAARSAGRLQDWPPIVLAGGLRPENVGDAIRIARPRAVDVSSGVEIEGQPGKKDIKRMRAFVEAARAAFEL